MGIYDYCIIYYWKIANNVSYSIDTENKKLWKAILKTIKVHGQCSQVNRLFKVELRENKTWQWILLYYQNPREASSRSRIFLNSLVYVCVYVCIYLFVSRLLAKRKTIQTWNLPHILPLTLSKNGFFLFFRSNHRDGR